MAFEGGQKRQDKTKITFKAHNHRYLLTTIDKKTFWNLSKTQSQHKYRWDPNPEDRINRKPDDQKINNSYSCKRIIAHDVIKYHGPKT